MVLAEASSLVELNWEVHESVGSSDHWKLIEGESRKHSTPYIFQMVEELCPGTG